MTDKLPRCVRCHDNRSVYEDGDRQYYCRLCKIVFDDEPDEAGDYYTDPTRRIQREEQRAAARRREQRRKAKRR